MERETTTILSKKQNDKIINNNNNNDDNNNKEKIIKDMEDVDDTENINNNIIKDAVENMNNVLVAPIQILCHSLIQRRKANKVSAPMIAYCLKIFVNSLYGICGVKGVLYDEVTASMITGYGRYHLMQAKEYFENNFVNLKVLYGDTDSIFISYDEKANPSLQEMSNMYNEHYLNNVLKIHTMELSAEANFQSIIFIRKKLYLAKLEGEKDDKARYKLSGFPKRLNRYLQKTMIEALHAILDLTISHSSDLQTNIETLYEDLFRKFISDTTINISDATYNVKVKSLISYKTPTCKNFYVGKLYEKNNSGFKISDCMYVAVCNIIPLIKKIPRKSFCVCLAVNYNPDLHTLNHSASLMEFLASTFDPILYVICSNSTRSLKNLSESYIKSLQNISQFKYVNQGYAVYNFSQCESHTFYIKISIATLWPEFYQGFVINEEVRGFRNKNGLFNTKIPWISEDFIKSINVMLKVDIHQRHVFQTLDNDNNISYVTIQKYQKSFWNTKPKYSHLKELENVIREVLSYERKNVPKKGLLLNSINNNNYNLKIIKNLYLMFNNNVITNLREILDLMCFIYKRQLNYSEINSLSANKFLLILPFIAIRKDGINCPLQFIYF